MSLPAGATPCRRPGSLAGRGSERVNDDAAVHVEQAKAELVDKAIEPGPGRARAPAGRRTTASATLLRAYYRHVAPEDLVDRSDVDLYGAFASHYKLAGNRPQGTAQVRVFTPTARGHGWSAGGHTVVEVVVDDMPFLVDSLTMELSRQLRDVHVVIHPQLRRRCATSPASCSRSTPVPTARSSRAARRVRESWMHVEIDRLPEGDDPAAIVDDIQRVLRDVREAVEDWPKMHAQVEAIVAELRSDPPPLDAERGPAGRRAAASGWPTSTSPSSATGVQARAATATTSTSGRSPAPGSASSAPTRTCRRRSAGCPPLVKAKAREKTLLVLAKANSRATVHRPAYLDYVGVKTFDADGEVDRRAPVPRPVLQRGLHRVADADPADPREGGRGAQAQSASTRAATPARR